MLVISTAVVILNWNGLSLLQEFLPNICAHSLHARIYVVDNASEDASVDWVRQHFPDVKLIQLRENLGYAGGYNAAITEIDEEILVLVNNDVKTTPNWLDAPLRLFQEKPEVVVIQPKIMDLKHPTHFEYAGAAGGFIDAFAYPYCRGRVFHRCEKDKGQFEITTDIFWASGACFFIRNQAFKAVGGFDADFFAHQEEVDLCWRLRNLDLRIIYCPESSIYHLGGATLQNHNPKKTFLNFRNSLITFFKNAPKRYVLLLLIPRLMLDGFAGIYFLFSLKWRHFFAVIHAHFSFYYRLPKLISFRKAARLKKNTYFKITSVAFAYFLLGKRTFLELHHRFR
ncbi:MAG: glycosyltransferase family 2 protein [Flavobacteriaceae bacterium]|nr:glycosyltransferase family 2 protein [Flavobacteriaceae bacterium]